MPYIEKFKEITEEMRVEKQSIDQMIKQLPPGRMRVHRRGEGLAFFLVDDNGQEHGIGRNKIIRDELAQKEFLMAKSDALNANINMCSSLISKMHPTNNDTIIGELHHGLQRLPKDSFFNKVCQDTQVPKPENNSTLILNQPQIYLRDISPQEWASNPYQENTKHYEEKKHLGTNGLYFRSRAEMLVATVYEKNGWNYHYDERLVTEDGIWFSPDFQHCKQSCELFYHEHCELDGNEDYDINFSRKLGIYLAAGIKPGKNLIITWSGKDGGLDLRRIEKTLMAYYD